MKIDPIIGTDNVPRCDTRCPSHDGKRCEILGHRPEGICEPAVRAMSKAFDLARAGECLGNIYPTDVPCHRDAYCSKACLDRDGDGTRGARYRAEDVEALWWTRRLIDRSDKGDAEDAEEAQRALILIDEMITEKSPRTDRTRLYELLDRVVGTTGPIANALSASEWHELREEFEICDEIVEKS